MSSDATSEVKEMRSKYEMKDRVYEIDLGEDRGIEKIIIYKTNVITSDSLT